MSAREDFARIVEDRLDFVVGFGAVRERDIAAISAAADEYRAEGQREALRILADRLDQTWRACSSETAAAAIRDNVIDPTMKDAASMARSFASGEFCWPPAAAVGVTAGARPVAEGDGQPAGAGEAQRGSQGRRGWDQ